MRVGESDNRALCGEDRYCLLQYPNFKTVAQLLKIDEEGLAYLYPQYWSHLYPGLTTTTTWAWLWRVTLHTDLTANVRSAHEISFGKLDTQLGCDTLDF